MRHVITALILALCAATAQAQPQSREMVLLETRVDAGSVVAFEDWIADYRAGIEGLRDNVMLSAHELCAYAGWTVYRGPQDGGDAVYYFLLDPFVAEVDYDLYYWLSRAYGEVAAAEKISAWQAMAGEQQFVTSATVVGAPMPPYEECAFLY